MAVLLSHFRRNITPLPIYAHKHSLATKPKEKNKIVTVSQVLDDLKMETFTRPDARGAAAKIASDHSFEQRLYPKGFDFSSTNHRWLDPVAVRPETRNERIRIVMSLLNMCIPSHLICLKMIERYKFWTRFLGDESLVRSKLGREYLILGNKTRLVQDNVRRLRLLKKLTVSESEKTEELRRQLKEQLELGLQKVKESFIRAKEDSDFEDLVVGQIRIRPQKERMGCVFSYLSQQLSDMSGEQVSIMEVRKGLRYHPFFRNISLSPIEVRDMLLFLVRDVNCSATQILNGIYVMLYHKEVVDRSFSSLQTLPGYDCWKEHPRLIDYLLYDVERSLSDITSRDLFGSGVFVDAMSLPAQTDKVPDNLPFPSPLPSYALLFQKKILH